jgi:hypothetical protein
MAFKISPVMADFSLHWSSVVSINFLVFNAVNEILNKQFSLKGATFLHYTYTYIRSLNPKPSTALIMLHFDLYLCNSYDFYKFIADINRLLCKVNSNVATVYFIIHSLVTAF